MKYRKILSAAFKISLSLFAIAAILYALSYLSLIELGKSISDIVPAALITSLVVAALSRILMHFMRGEKETIDRIADKVAAKLNCRISEGAMECQKNGLAIRYAMEYVPETEGASRIMHRFSAETGSELPKLCIAIGEKRRAEVYPKESFSSYSATRLRGLLESDKDAKRLLDADCTITMTSGGKCISPKFGMFAGSRRLLSMDVSSELTRENLFYEIFSKKGEEVDEAGCANEWAELISQGMSLMEKISRAVGEE